MKQFRFAIVLNWLAICFLAFNFATTSLEAQKKGGGGRSSTSSTSSSNSGSTAESQLSPSYRNASFKGEAAAEIYKVEKERADLSSIDAPEIKIGQETFYQPSNYDALRLDAHFYRHRIDELDIELDHTPKVINLAGMNSFLTQELAKREETDLANLSIHSMEPTLEAFRNEIDATVPGRPLIVIAHVPDDRSHIANLDESAKLDWSAIREHFTDSKRLTILMGCNSVCLADAPAGLDGKFDEILALSSLSKISKANTVGDLYQAIGKSADGFVLRSTVAGYSGRAKTKSGDRSWVDVVNFAAGAELTEYESELANLNCDASVRGEAGFQICLKDFCQIKNMGVFYIDRKCETPIEAAASLSVMCLEGTPLNLRSAHKKIKGPFVTIYVENYGTLPKEPRYEGRCPNLTKPVVISETFRHTATNERSFFTSVLATMICSHIFFSFLFAGLAASSVEEKNGFSKFRTIFRKLFLYRLVNPYSFFGVQVLTAIITFFVLVIGLAREFEVGFLIYGFFFSILFIWIFFSILDGTKEVARKFHKNMDR